MSQHMLSVQHETYVTDKCLSFTGPNGYTDKNTDTISVRFQSGFIIHSGYFKQGIKHKD